MKRYKIQVDDLGIEPDCIVDTKTNKLYEHYSADTYELCNLLNSKDYKWQELKEFVSKYANNYDESISSVCYLILEKMDALEKGEKDEQD